MSPRRLSTLALILTVTIWASTFVVTKWVLDEAGPFTVTALRFLIGFAALLLPAWRQGFRFHQVLQPAMIRYGMTGIVLFFGLQNLGLLFTSAGNAALISAALPGAAAVISYYLLGEKISRLRLAGIALSVAGVLLVSGARPESAGPLTLLGNGLILGSMLAWAVYAVQGKKLPATTPALVATTASMGAGLLVLIPAAGVELALQGLPALSPAGLLSLLYLGCGASALTLFLWNYAIRHVDASAASLYPNLIPLAGLLFAWAGGEPVTPVQVLGGALAMAGVWLSERQVLAEPPIPDR